MQKNARSIVLAFVLLLLLIDDWINLQQIINTNAGSTAATKAINITVPSATNTTTGQAGSQAAVLVAQGSSVNMSEGTPAGGTPPYNYQWLGAFSNNSGAFSAGEGNLLCGSTAQNPTCSFRTVVSTGVLSPGRYYLKLRVADSSLPPQSANSFPASVNVQFSIAANQISTTVQSSSSSSQTTTIPPALTVGQPTSPVSVPAQGVGFTISDSGASGGTPPYAYRWLVSYSTSSGPYLAGMAYQLCGNSYQSASCGVGGPASFNMQAGIAYYFKLQATDSSHPVLTTNSSSIGIWVHT